LLRSIRIIRSHVIYVITNIICYVVYTWKIR